MRTWSKHMTNVQEIQLRYNDRWLECQVWKITTVFPLGKENLHEKSNGNVLRVISFETGKNMIISSTKFPHKRIYNGTRKSSDSITINQIDHVLIQKRLHSCIVDLCSYRKTHCGTNHFLVIVKFKLKLQSQKSLESRKNVPYNLERLKYD